MKNMKKFSLTLILILSMFLIIGCGKTVDNGASEDQDKKEDVKQEDKQEQNANKDTFPEKPITVIVSFGAGGGTDIGARILLPYVEDELGVPLTVVNKPGGGGWVGWNDLLNQKNDGYTIGYINTPNLITGYMNPEMKRTNNLDDFALISNHVLDYGAIAVRGDDERFNTLDDLIEYAKDNELTATSTGVAGDDHMAILKVNKNTGTQFVPVHGKGSTYGKAGVLGGHIDVFFANVGEVTVPAKNGEMKVLGVLSPERSHFLPDVPTLEEKGYGKTYSWSARGLTAPKGIDEDRLNIIRDAFEKALNNPEHIKEMEKMGLAVKPIVGEEYYEFLKSDEESISELKDLLGW